MRRSSIMWAALFVGMIELIVALYFVGVTAPRMFDNTLAAATEFDAAPEFALVVVQRLNGVTFIG